MDRKEFLAFRGPVTAVRSWCATPEIKKRALSRFESLRIVADLRRDSPPILAELIALASGVAPVRPRQADCLLQLAELEKAIESGWLLFVDGWESMNRRHKPAPQSPVPQEKSADHPIQQLMPDNDHIEFEGKRYRWVSTLDRKNPENDGFHPVPAAELIPLVKRMASKVAKTAEQKAAWDDIEKKLSQAGTDNRQPAGKRPILLRHAPTVVPARAPDAAPAVTPSQLRPKTATEHWIELEIVYDDGTPFDGNSAVELPGGRIADGPPNGKGIIRIDALTAAGDCKVKLPALDGDSFAVK